MGVEAGAGPVLGPLVRPEGVRHPPHLHVGPVLLHVVHDGLHQVMVVVPGVVAEYRGDLMELGWPQPMNAPGVV